MTIFWLLALLWGILIFVAPIMVLVLRRDLQQQHAALKTLGARLLALEEHHTSAKPASSTKPTSFSSYPTETVEDKLAIAEKPSAVALLTPSTGTWVHEKISSSDVEVRQAPIYQADTVQGARTPSDNHSFAQTPQEDSLFPAWLGAALSGGKLFVVLGIILLFIGSALLFGYVARFVTFPVTLRYFSVAVAACGMIVAGLRFYHTRPSFGLYLTGGGLGLLFLTVFSSYKFHALLSPYSAFALLILIGAATFALSLRYNALALSMIALAGGFSAPILTSTGSGNYIGLFSYYLLLNLVIFAVAWFKSWRVLNTLGFAFTFTIGLLWGGKYYTPEHYLPIQCFLIAYFLLYSAIGLLFSWRTAPSLTQPVDSASVFGVPLIGLMLQFALVKHIPNGETISALVLGCFYAAVYLLLRRSDHPNLRILQPIACGFSLFFFTLAVCLEVDTRIAAALLALEGAALLWMHAREKAPVYLWIGAALLFISNLLLLAGLESSMAYPSFINAQYTACIGVAVAHILGSYFLAQREGPMLHAKGLSALGVAWWFYAMFSNLESLLGHDEPMIWLIVLTVNAILAWAVIVRWIVPMLDYVPLAVMPVAAGIVIAEFLGFDRSWHPTTDFGWLALPLAFALHYRYVLTVRFQHSRLYVLPFYLLTFIVAAEISWLFVTPSGALHMAGWILAPLGALILLYSVQRYPLPPVIPLHSHRIALGWPLWFTLYGAMLISFTHASLLNSMVEILSFARICMLLRLPENTSHTRSLHTPLALLGFLAFNATLLRFACILFDAEYGSTMLFAPEIQSTITLAWTIIAIAAMIYGSRLMHRPLWIAGGTLLGLVILRLFFVDLANSGTLSRIVSFLGVGMLTVLLGYISPMPPSDRTEDKAHL